MSLFQSTPANFTAGDHRVLGAPQPAAAVSIHARQFHSGRHLFLRRLDEMLAVSIHARQFHSGRPVCRKNGVSGQEFQSTPANFTAGDVLSLIPFFSSSKFQSTPANFTAGDAPREALGAWVRRFNPRPPISQRATDRQPGRRDHVAVSIHARQFHSGRPCNSKYNLRQ